MDKLDIFITAFIKGFNKKLAEHENNNLEEWLEERIDNIKDIFETKKELDEEEEKEKEEKKLSKINLSAKPKKINPVIGPKIK
ncbi:MAG: hypothetical protein ACP5LM_05590 [Thermoplasmata archaeon]